MKKSLIIIFAILIVLVGAAGVWWHLSKGRLPVRFRLQKVAERAAQNVAEVAEKVSAPPPLRATVESPAAHLTRAGIVNETNRQRKNNGLAALTVSAELSAAAAVKAKDMFAKQYFEHISPTGVGPGELAKDAGYAYIVVGENLALGNFLDDKAVVGAWMASPKHRENILGKSYVEIGIAAVKGTYEGKSTWIAVQEFGKPKSACPEPDPALKAKIDDDEARFQSFKSQVDQLKAAFDSAPKLKTQEEIDAYNSEVDRHNGLVRQMNELVGQIQGEITVYNGQVETANACAGE